MMVHPGQQTGRRTKFQTKQARCTRNDHSFHEAGCFNPKYFNLEITCGFHCQVPILENFTDICSDVDVCVRVEIMCL